MIQRLILARSRGTYVWCRFCLWCNHNFNSYICVSI
nr:MAG TPA: hypothetical protein [Caudoviricetes sp.]